MKILFISDTHCFHDELTIPKDIDMIIHSGDSTNARNQFNNIPEAREFLHWYDSLNVKYKIFVAGNHDTSIEQKLINPRDYSSISYLEHESITIEGINIFGSPYTPEFYNWAFNVRKDRLHNYWSAIPDNTNILVTHGPPKYIMDLSKDINGKLEFCGDNALYKRVLDLKECKYHSFGHIHESDECYNKGIRKLNDSNTIFINASCVTDSKFHLGLTSKGIIIDY